MVNENTNTNTMEQAAAEAVKVISDAAAKATSAIAAAAETAAKVVANTADLKTKSFPMQTMEDHNLIIKLDTKMDALKDDIADLKSGTSTKIENHEIRIKSLEDAKTRTTVMLGIGIFLLTAVFSMMVYHLQH